MSTTQPRSALPPAPASCGTTAPLAGCLSSATLGACGWVEWVGEQLPPIDLFSPAAGVGHFKRKMAYILEGEVHALPSRPVPGCPPPSLAFPTPPSVLIWCPRHRGLPLPRHGLHTKAPCCRTVCLTGDSARVVCTGRHIVGAVLNEGLWRWGEMRAWGERSRQKGEGRSWAQLQALPVLNASFAAVSPAGASSECLFKSLHEAQLLNLFCICKDQIHLPFLKVKLLKQSFKFTMILLSNSSSEWGVWSHGSWGLCQETLRVMQRHLDRVLVADERGCPGGASFR